MASSILFNSFVEVKHGVWVCLRLLQANLNAGAGFQTPYYFAPSLRCVSKEIYKRYESLLVLLKIPGRSPACCSEISANHIRRVFRAGVMRLSKESLLRDSSI